MSPNAYLLPQGNQRLTIVAWAITILVSAVPDILYFELVGAVPTGLIFAKMGFLFLLSLAALIWVPLRPLRDYFIVMFAFFGLSELRVRLDFSIPALQSVLGALLLTFRCSLSRQASWRSRWQ